jgi:ABC-type uncharacterized transport system substrate-binding protein
MLKKIFLAVILISVFLALLPAHPHTFIYSTLAPEFEGKSVKGVWVEWTFDEMFSSQVIMEADTNGNKKLEPTEVDYIFDHAFINLKNYDYFFYQRDGKERFGAQTIEEFDARIKGNTLVYRFFVPLERKTNPLIISLIDSTFFCALSYNKNKPVYFVKAEGVTPQYRLEQNKDYPIYYNPMGAIDDDRIYTKFQKGLQTAYPKR